MGKRLALVLVLAIGCALTGSSAGAAESPRKVLAFYYPWYVHRLADGRSPGQSNWTAPDPITQRIGNSAHYPQLGPYDSQDPKVIGQHCEWARQAGIDGFIASWWGKDSPTDQALPRVLDACADAHLEATIYYETVKKPQTVQAAVDELLELLRRYANHPAWLRAEGKPVVFVYGRAIGELKLEGWRTVVKEVEARHPGGAVLVGDDPSPAAAKVFHGLHTYNPVAAMAGKSLDDVRAWAQATYPQWVGAADRQRRISTVTVVPGYDDTKIRKPGLRVDRLNGNFYEAQWNEALAADPHWVLITSWNEWYEGSEIEPSGEFGKFYLRLTAQATARFRKLGPRGGK